MRLTLPVFAGIVATGLLLSACTLPKPPNRMQTTLPYQFQITGFADDREISADPVRAQQPFPQNAFLQAFVKHMRHSMYGSKQAKLKMALTHYEITQHERDFTISMGVNMQATSHTGKTLVDKVIPCQVDHHRGPLDLKIMAEQAYDNPYIVTNEGWSQEVTYRLLAKCSEKLAQNFAMAVIQGTNAEE